MWPIWFFMLCVCSMHIVHHETHGAYQMQESVRPDSSWLIVIQRRHVVMDEIQNTQFLAHLKEHLLKDACVLQISKTSERTIILRIHCPLLVLDSETEVETIKMSPTLRHTEPYLDALFGLQNVIVERNSILSHPAQWHVGYESTSFHSHPTQWHGRYEHVETIMKGESDHLLGYRVNPKLEQELLYQGNAVEINAPWHLDRIDMRFGFLNGQYIYLNEAPDVDVYTLDTGILTTHVEFEGRAVFLHNAVPDGITTDCNGHGTHVAGIAVGKTYGVAKKARLFAVRVLNCSGDGFIDDIVEGADVIIANAETQKPRRAVINLSLGGDQSGVIDAMVRQLRANNMVVILAAGNANSDACRFSPSDLGANNFVLTVGASNRNDQRPSYSNFGSCVSISAGGDQVTSAWPTSNTATNTISGTSMSAPAVSGVAALVLQQNADLSVDTANAMIVAWATPNIIAGTTQAGGGRNLLYSLIDASVPLDQLTQVPTSNNANGANSNKANSVNILLCITLTILFLFCVL
jgi:subtilisin family serine protease